MPPILGSIFKVFERFADFTLKNQDLKNKFSKDNFREIFKIVKLGKS